MRKRDTRYWLYSAVHGGSSQFSFQSLSNIYSDLSFSLLYFFLSLPLLPAHDFQGMGTDGMLKKVISTWHYRCVLTSGDLQNLNILIFKIARHFKLRGLFFFTLNEAKATFIHVIQSPTKTNRQSRASSAPLSSLS